MYVEHPAFESLADENAKIWRYLDFTKFVALLDWRALSFARVDELTDQFEGSLRKADAVSLLVGYANPPTSWSGPTRRWVAFHVTHPTRSLTQPGLTAPRLLLDGYLLDEVQTLQAVHLYLHVRYGVKHIPYVEGPLYCVSRG